MENLINEQKALELAELTSINDDERYYQPHKCEIYDKCLEMAKWKEEQLIGKACDTIENLLSGYIIRNFHFGDSYDEDKLIEDFKQAMKGE